MIGDLLEKKLKGLKGNKILVVMDDGLAFLGDLVEYDSNTLVLKEVNQAPAKKIKWKEIPKEGEEVEKVVGYIDWTSVNLEEVYIRMEHVLRIWHWKDIQPEDETREKGETRKRPIYTRDEAMPDERGASMGDIQDTFRY
ncbi:MAG: hypothetical protein V5A88_00860 [Candidatus Thermoplasmatota archaeon]